MIPGFLTAKDATGWRTDAGVVSGTYAGMTVTAERRWWGGRWRVAVESPWPVPEHVLVYVSRRGMEHGFWRDLPVGERRFDRDHFVFSDTPALLPLVVGPATRTALSAPRTGDDLVLYARGGVTRTEGTTGGDDEAALDRHLAVHRALADDHAGMLASWTTLMEDAHGRPDPGTWPPSGNVLCRSGTLLVKVRWRKPATRDASDWEDAQASLRTHVSSVEERTGRHWSIIDLGHHRAGTYRFGDRHYEVRGEPTISIAAIEPLIQHGQVAQLVVGKHVHVALRGLASARQFAAAVRLAELAIAPGESTSPYR